MKIIKFDNKKQSTSPNPFLQAMTKWVIVLIIMVLAISLLDLTGWAFDITLLKSISAHWVSMERITAICFILAVTAFLLTQVKFPSGSRKILSGVFAGVICLVSLLVFYVSFYSFRTGYEASLTEIPWLSFIFAPEARMGTVTTVNFFLTGCVLLLLATGKTTIHGIAHALMVPVALASYFIPASYIIGVYSLHDYKEIPVAINTGIAFCLFCAAVFMSRPGTWLMKVTTSSETGSIFFRKVLPALIALPLVIGWLRIKGERKGLFESDEGVVLVAITYTISFLIIMWLVSKSVNQIDSKRHAADEALKKTNAELDQRVKERTEELTQLNRILDAEIIERGKAQEILVAEQRRFSEVLELIPAYIILLTPDYRVTYANRYFRERFGENTRMLRCYEYLFNRHEPCEVCETYKVLKDNNSHTWEWKGPDGRYYSIFDFPFTDADGSPLIMEVGIDVTELKQAETALKNINMELEERVKARTNELLESKAKMDMALENANVGIWELDLRTLMLEWDKRMGIMLGMDPEQKSKKFDSIEKVIVEEDLPHLRKAMTDLIDRDIPLDTIFRVVRKNTDINHISLKALVVKDMDGNPIKMTGACFDITGMKRGAEQTIFMLNDDLLRSNKELEQFAYVASHDLQEPLRMVSSFTQLLYQRYKDKLDPEANEFINYAVDGATRMQALINDLLEYSRVTTRGKNKVPNDMHHILGQVLKNLSMTIKEKNALVTNDELPVVQSDGGQMVQLFQNLIDNALKFCLTTPRIHISVKEEQDLFLFSVADNGIGIERTYFERVFQIFQRLHTRDEFQGTGIGLAICQRIVERHGGKIWVESTLGEGTTFKFTVKK